MMRELFFTVLVTCVSRGMILRDRMLGRPGRGVDGPGAMRHQIPSGANCLDAMLVEPVGQPVRAALMICHGIGETVEHWRAAQGLLAEHGVASLVFNYSGYGRSSGRVDAAQWERDAVEAFGWLQRRMSGMGVSVLGYSLGSGVAAAVMDRLEARRLVLCASFPSLRRAARRSGAPAWMAGWLPDIWNNVEALRRGSVPVLVVHGADDRLFPVAGAQEMAEACGARCELVVVPGVTHNGPIFAPRMEFWGAVIERL